MGASQARSVERKRPVPPAKLAHVVFRSARFDAMRDWYATVLGARVGFDDGRLCFMTYDDEHHRVAVIRMPNAAPRDERAVGVDHVAFTFAGLGDLLGTYARLKEEGIAPYWCINHGPTTSLYYRDPDGNRVELQIDNFETAEGLKAFFRSGTFKKNPIGVEYDPDALLERYERGDPVEELVKQGAA